MGVIQVEYPRLISGFLCSQELGHNFGSWFFIDDCLDFQQEFLHEVIVLTCFRGREFIFWSYLSVKIS
jgi:hypothetical protein